MPWPWVTCEVGKPTAQSHKRKGTGHEGKGAIFGFGCPCRNDGRRNSIFRSSVNNTWSATSPTFAIRLGRGSIFKGRDESGCFFLCRDEVKRRNCVVVPTKCPCRPRIFRHALSQGCFRGRKFASRKVFLWPRKRSMATLRIGPCSAIFSSVSNRATAKRGVGGRWIAVSRPKRRWARCVGSRTRSIWWARRAARSSSTNVSGWNCPGSGCAIRLK